MSKSARFTSLLVSIFLSVLISASLRVATDTQAGTNGVNGAAGFFLAQ